MTESMENTSILGCLEQRLSFTQMDHRLCEREPLFSSTTGQKHSLIEKRTLRSPSMEGIKVHQQGYMWNKLVLIFTLCLLMCCASAGTITGSVSFTPTTIRTDATYTFELANSQLLNANERITILFPTNDFSFAHELTTTVAKIYTPLTGMASTGITSCTLDKTTNTLTMVLAAQTTALTITFTVAGIRNPLFSKTTGSLTIRSFTSASVAIDSSIGTYTLTATPGVLGVTLTSASSTVGATESLKFSLALTNTIGTDGKIHILLPKWNPDSSTPQSIFAAANPSCVSVLGVSTIVCTYSTNVDSLNTQDKIVVSGAFTSGATTIEFSISNYKNPPSTKPLTTIQVYTSTTTEANVLDEDNSISLTMTTAATLPSSTISITPTDTEINAKTTYTFKIRVFNPLPVGASILITFPAAITPTSTSVTALGTGKLNTLIVTDYNSATRILTMTEVIISQSSYVTSGDIEFSLSTITNPSSTATTSSFRIQTFEGIDYAIEAVSSAVTVTATPGDILTFFVSPDNKRIRERTFYDFTFVTENAIPVGASLRITFPTEIVIENRSASSCVSDGTSISTAALCTVTSTSILVISGGFPTTAVTAGSTISFKVNSILNANTVQPTSYFQAQFQDSSSNIVDIYKYTNVTVTFVVNTLQNFSIAPTSTFTGVSTTYRFTINSATDKEILRNSIVQIVFPSEILIADTAASAASCGSQSGFPSTITCSFPSADTLQLNGGFASTSFIGGNLIFSIGGIRNPRSTATTLSFKVYVKDANEYGQYSIESGKGIAVANPSDFTSVVLTRDSTINGETTTYYFTITLSNIINNGDYIQTVFPSSVYVRSIVNQCAGITNIQSSLVCSLDSSTMLINVALLSGVTQLPTTAGDTSTQIKFSISNVRNPLSMSTSSSIQIFILTSNKNNRINSKTTGLTVTNTGAGAITNATVSPDNSALGATTNYLVSFKPSNSIEQNTRIRVTIPSQVGVDTSSTMTCTAVLIIESTMTCTYDSATRQVTILNGFLSKTSYVSSQVEFKISNLVNPSTATTTDSFSIFTLTPAGVLYNSISSGLTYTKECTSPCKTCETDLSTCTSCYDTSTFAFLSEGTCVTSCPAGEYSSSNVCLACQSPCATCSGSATNCLSCISNPQLYLYNSGCVSECPSLYEVSSSGISCEKVGEIIVPFVPLGLWLVFVLIISIVKCMRKGTMFLSSLIVITGYFVFLLMIIIIILFFRDDHYQSGSLALLSLLILICLNISWTCCVYRKTVRSDILFEVWKEAFPKTEQFVYWSSYVACFQSMRISFCQFAHLIRFDASIKTVQMMYIRLNRFSILLILLVLLPALCACIYNLFWTTYMRQVFWHDIELIVILVVFIIILVLDVWLKDESALLETYVDKNEVTKNIDITDKSMLTHTIFNTKEDMLTGRSFRRNMMVPGKNNENDMLREAVYNKFGQQLYNDVFKQKIGNFDQLIHEQKDGEVHSQYSETFEPNKNFKEFDPFKEKYNEKSPHKSGDYSSPQKSGKNINNSLNYSKASVKNYRSGNTGNKQDDESYAINLDSNGEVIDHSRVPNETTKNISNSQRGEDSSYDTYPVHEFNNDLRAEQDGNDLRRNMMRTQNPSNRLGGFQISEESNAVINARQELKTEIEKKGILQGTQKHLDDNIKDLNAQILALEREKFKLRLNRDSTGSQDSQNFNSRQRKDAEIDSRGTQYLRTDLYGDSDGDKVRENVEKSLKLESNANQWLKNNKKLISSHSKQGSGSNRGSEDSQLSSPVEEEKRFREQTSNNPTSGYNTKIGPSVPLTSKAADGGLMDDLEWSFSDGISEFSEKQREGRSGSVDLAFEANLNDNPRGIEKSAPRPKKKAKKKGKKVKKSKGVKSKSNKPQLDFYTKKEGTYTNSSIPDASNVPTPKFKKNRRSINKKSVSPRNFTSNRYNSSIDNEGGSKATFSNIRESQSDVFWSSSPQNHKNYSKRKQAMERNMNRQPDGVAFDLPYIRNCVRHTSASPGVEKSSPRVEGYRDCLISPRAQDEDYIMRDAENSAFKREYRTEAGPSFQLPNINN